MLERLTKCIEKLMSPEFSSLSTLLDNSTWHERMLDIYRCSVFSEHFNNIDKLENRLNSVTLLDKKEFRNQFKSLIHEILRQGKIYSSDKKGNNAVFVEHASQDLIIKLTEKSDSILYLPCSDIVFIGHDDFGFIILSKKGNQYFKFYKNLILKQNLYLHEF